MKIFKRVVMSIYLTLVIIVCTPIFAVHTTFKSIWSGRLDNLKGFGSNLIISFTIKTE